MSFDRCARRNYRRWRLPLDRLALGLMLGLLVVAGLLVLLGDHAVAKVQRFSWQESTVGAENMAFTLTFTRPMDPDTVEANLQITPELPGRISWAGRRMAYTLDGPTPYGETYEVSLPDARDRFSENGTAVSFEPFESTFQSRDRAVAYIATEGAEAGRLMLINFSQESAAIPLTPPDWQVLDFEPYPLGDRILFSAVQGASRESAAASLSPELYAVATGLAPLPPEDLVAIDSNPSFEPGDVGELTLMLDSDVYQNLAFDLSPNGKKIVVQRVNQASPADFGPWVIAEDSAPQPLETEPGGEFLIGPDSESLLMLQGQGTAVIPLSPSAEGETMSEPLDFLPEFGRVFDVTSDGTAAAMVDFNQNDPERRFIETLVLVTNQGEETPLLDATGAIINAEFDPTNRILYVLASELLPGEAYREQPYLAAIALNDDPEPLRMLNFPPQARVSMDISPDGLAALLAIAVSPDGSPNNEQIQTVLLPLFQTTEQRLAGTPSVSEPNILPLTAMQPTWLP
ncbi:MAG: Ig-like domain-containing protein [Leptolyngbya sp. SIOISBB]|nr:Ig-like domain-containing protein [Leptolyngbya sp. SIOISBB]